jgi:agmatinase
MTNKNQLFAGIEGKHNEFEQADILLQSIPYDGTSTWGKGADQGFEAFLDAAENMEVYDIETDSEVYKKGVHIIDPILEDASPEAVFEAVYNNTKELLKTDKFLTFFGGEHSISIGAIKAFYEAHPDITILQIDAHADLRPEYHGSPYNHACAVYDASINANLIQVGIRSMDSSEVQYMDKDKCYLAEDMFGQTDWMADSLSKMTDQVYITLDLDVFDPSIMPATGTPEPGGMNWNTMIQYLKKVFHQKNVLGFDIVELAPIEGLSAPQFMTAKLYYKMLSYKFFNS